MASTFASPASVVVCHPTSTSFCSNHILLGGSVGVGTIAKKFEPIKRVMLSTKCSTSSSTDVIKNPNLVLPSSDLTFFGEPHHTHGASQFLNSVDTQNIVDKVVLLDLDPATSKLAISLLGPFLSAFGFLFILRIIMSWYPKLPVKKFPYVIAYAPTEPILGPTRKLIPPLAGVDVTPVVWFGLISFLSEILVGPQGLLVLLSQKVSPS